MDIKKSAMELNDYAIGIRRELHAHPELSFDLPFTEGVVVRELEAMGFTNIRRGIGGGHGVTVDLVGAKPGKTLALRADMDALPIREETGLPFASDNGCMHACGHDAHTAMLLATAKLLSGAQGELAGTVRFLFQPSEEPANGAAVMVKDGALDGVDTIIGLHTGNLWAGLKAGQIGWKVGPFMAATTTFNVELKGKSAHGATPHLGVDTITMAALIISQLQLIVSREMNPFDPRVLTVGHIEGGTTTNIVADFCRFRGVIRSFSTENSAFMKERIVQTVEQEAASLRGTGTVAFSSDLPPVVNDEALTLKMRDIIHKELGVEFEHEIAMPTTGAEDFAEYTKTIPGAFFYHCSTFGDERDCPHHNAHFMVNESVLWTGVAAMAAFALDWQK
ncbi:MAG: amidohydrolase [Clostridia bacterium]|nr:amidohydrolase [Clostridia bacterium]